MEMVIVVVVENGDGNNGGGGDDGGEVMAIMGYWQFWIWIFSGEVVVTTTLVVTVK